MSLFLSRRLSLAAFLFLFLVSPDFLHFCFSGNLRQFYQDLRWLGWEQEIKQLKCYPFLFFTEGKNLAQVKRSVVPLAELWAFGQDMRRQLTGEQ